MIRAGLLLAVAGLAAACTNDAGIAMPVDPAVIYTQMCARCHGVDGHGDPHLRKQMPMRDFADPEVRRQQGRHPARGPAAHSARPAAAAPGR